MTNEWYIQIFPTGKNKKQKEAYNIAENRTIEKQEIGINFYGCIPRLDDHNKLLKLDFTDRGLETFNERQKKYKNKVFTYFINNMKVNDIIYLKNGSKILYKAKIASDYILDETNYKYLHTQNLTEEDFNTIKNDNWFWRHRRKIKDIEKIYEIKSGYSRQTLYCKKL